jgi:hypothetical protein
MLTLIEKSQLGNSGEWIQLVTPAVAQVAVDVQRENPASLSFGAHDAALADNAALKAQLQFTAHERRAALARATMATRDALNKSAQTWAMALASNMCERIEEQQVGAGVAYANLLRAFMAGVALSPEQKAQLDGVLVAVIRESVSAIAGFNAAYEIPKALA